MSVAGTGHVDRPHPSAHGRVHRAVIASVEDHRLAEEAAQELLATSAGGDAPEHGDGPYARHVGPGRDGREVHVYTLIPGAAKAQDSGRHHVPFGSSIDFLPHPCPRHPDGGSSAGGIPLVPRGLTGWKRLKIGIR